MGVETGRYGIDCPCEEDTMDETITVGTEFTHAYMLNPDWRPGPGQTYAQNCPYARCVVTAVRNGAVYYGYVGQRHGSWWVARDEFDRIRLS